MSTDPERFTFSSSAQGGDRLKVTGFTGVEHLSQPFEFLIQLATTNQDELDFSDILQGTATLTVQSHQGSVKVNGVIADFALHDRGSDWVKYQARLVPQLWALGMGRHSRIFQNMTVPDIVKEVLGARVEADFVLRGTYPEREYVVQWQESDIAFIERLLAREGIFYCFDHQRDSRLVFADQATDYLQIAGPSAIEFKPPASAGAAIGTNWSIPESIASCAREQRVVLGEVALKDWNWRRPGTDLTVTKTVADKGIAGAGYEYGDHYPDADQGNRLVAVRAEEQRSRQHALRGVSDHKGLRAGSVFALTSHPVKSMNRKYVVVSARHHAAQGLERGSGTGQGTSFRSEFTALAHDAPWRPSRRGGKPVIHGVINARIDAAGDGQYAELDDEGRYRVILPFDRSGKQGGNASRAVRMSQPYGGNDMGLHFPLRKGTEVLLAHVGGDPDRPIITGAVPNPDHPSLLTASNQTNAVMRTPGKNELRFEDLQGKERVFLHAERDRMTEVVRDDDHTIGGSQSVAVTGAQQVDIGASQSISIGSTKTENIAAASVENVGGAKAVDIGAAYAINVGAAMNEAVGGAKTEEVGAFKHETVAKDRSLSVGDSLSVTVGKSHADKAGKDRVIEAEKIRIEAKESIVIICGKAKISMAKNGDIVIEGGKITMKGSSDVVIKGSKIAAN
ncbi:MAG: type VI secretion system tip protein VgrG [Planctomycetes bacterium]|nr:type VI secretion system tip protein VgrG [Planctomycetota bacterium]